MPIVILAYIFIKVYTYKYGEMTSNNYLERGCGAAINGMAFACNDCYTLMYQQQQIKYLTTSQVATLFRVS